MAARTAILLAAAGALLTVGGCGESHQRQRRSAVEERRAGLVAVAHALAALRERVAVETAASRAVWPRIDRGLKPRRRRNFAHRRAHGARAAPKGPAKLPESLKQAISVAARQAGAMPAELLPEAGRLTGAASALASTYALYRGLGAHAWAIIEAAANSAAPRPSAAAEYLRANTATYIIGVYDAQFDLSDIGESLRAAYKRLGGERAFGRRLRPAEVEAIAAAYSPAALRLRPHPWRVLAGQ